MIVDLFTAQGQDVVIVDRGNCPLTAKANNAEAAGASVLLIVNNQKELYKMVCEPDETDLDIKIPAVICSLKMLVQPWKRCLLTVQKRHTAQHSDSGRFRSENLTTGKISPASSAAENKLESWWLEVVEFGGGSGQTGSGSKKSGKPMNQKSVQISFRIRPKKEST
ncbi:hypothetical protein F2Q68_00025840 [Brassica cretica]|uniref:PA domain-containing protein n=1 Tax=Brassica cretica TaxID=69181 RepID=A0A8S9I6R6_BRACR|nr:hypothetical protein F2Q68_00025840 [Brassica cretica]